MKSLAVLALSTIATAVMAAGEVTPNHISISGTSEQVASINGGNVRNVANANTYTNQNLASNKGGIDISGHSKQSAALQNTYASNEAKASGDVAVQNLASNVGEVSVLKSGNNSDKRPPHHGDWIKGRSEQTVSMVNSTLINQAESENGCHGDKCKDTAVAYQNLASNMGTITITGKSEQLVGADNATIQNYASGKNTVAIQNLSSNYGDVAISGSSTQTSYVHGGATLTNLALGANARAYQNFATNDSCDPPPTVCVGPHCLTATVASK